MWSPSAPLIRVGLSAHGVSIARLPRFGLGLGMGLSLGRQAEVAHLPIALEAMGETEAALGTARSTNAKASTEPWRPAVERLAEWLAAQKGKRFQVQLVLSGRWTRWQLLPWRAELSGAAERAAFAALRFRETFGASAQQWQILPADQAPGQTAPAAAVDTLLVDALQAACHSAGAQLHSITPYFSSAFDTWRGSLQGSTVWFGTLESDTLTLGLLQGTQWRALQTQRLGADWRVPLRTLMAHMTLACNVPEGGAPLYLAGDMPEPLARPGTDKALAFTWLSPKPLHQPTPPGLRLAMGC